MLNPKWHEITFLSCINPKWITVFAATNLIIWRQLSNDESSIYTESILDSSFILTIFRVQSIKILQHFGILWPSFYSVCCTWLGRSAPSMCSYFMLSLCDSIRWQTCLGVHLCCVLHRLGTRSSRDASHYKTAPFPALATHVSMSHKHHITQGTKTATRAIHKNVNKLSSWRSRSSTSMIFALNFQWCVGNDVGESHLFAWLSRLCARPIRKVEDLHNLSWLIHCRSFRPGWQIMKCLMANLLIRFFSRCTCLQ
jgi:hypothetical protein